VQQRSVLIGFEDFAGHRPHSNFMAKCSRGPIEDELLAPLTGHALQAKHWNAPASVRTATPNPSSLTCSPLLIHGQAICNNDIDDPNAQVQIVHQSNGVHPVAFEIHTGIAIVEKAHKRLIFHRDWRTGLQEQ